MEPKLIQLNLTEILKKRMGGWKKKLIPSLLLRSLEKLICQDELNGILKAVYPKRGVDFCKGVYRHLNIEIKGSGLDELPVGGSYVFASNHPLGGLDGLGLIWLLGDKFGKSNVKFIVNDLLMNVEPLEPVFLPVNKYGNQQRSFAKAMNDAFAGDEQMAVFPAGLVSRLHPDGTIRDLRWQKSFVVKAIETGRMIVPVKFEAQNRRRFYRIARLRKQLKIRVNIEQIFLPSELVAASNRTFTVKFGRPINPLELKGEGVSVSQIVDAVRQASEAL